MTPSALTREQVETTVSRFLSWHECEAECDHDLKQVLATDAALRLTIEQQAQEIERLKNRVGVWQEDANRWHKEYQHSEQRLVESEKAAYDVAGTIDHLKATLAAREMELDKLKAELNETWVDERETVWTRPTAWAYAMVCKAKDKHEQEAERLREALAALHAVQNGSPLPSYDKDWNTAMQLTERALNGQSASGSSGGSANHGGQA